MRTAAQRDIAKRRTDLTKLRWTCCYRFQIPTMKAYGMSEKAFSSNLKARLGRKQCNKAVVTEPFTLCNEAVVTVRRWKSYKLHLPDSRSEDLLSLPESTLVHSKTHETAM